MVSAAEKVSLLPLILVLVYNMPGSCAVLCCKVLCLFVGQLHFTFLRSLLFDSELGVFLVISLVGDLRKMRFLGPCSFVSIHSRTFQTEL